MTRLLTRAALALVLVAVAAGTLAAHDLFLKLDRYFALPNSVARVSVLNGTFTKSEGSVKADRLRDLSLVVGDSVAAIDTTKWAAGTTMSVLTLRTGAPGTYLVAASLLPREISLQAKDFNKYLEEDGVPDILARRKAEGQLEDSAHERYSKHVKAVFQVGTVRTGGFDRVFGYPAELVPLDNPYALRRGRTLRFRAYSEGDPLPNQLILAGGRTTAGGRIPVQRVRADSAGIAAIRLTRAGVWYVKFIHMVPVTDGGAVNYESKWATVTFAVR